MGKYAKNRLSVPIKFLKSHIKEWHLVAALVVFAIVTHLNWFNPLSHFSYADFRYVYDDLAKSYIDSYSTWLTYKSWGVPNVQIYFYPIYSIISLLTHLGLGAMNAIKFVYFIPTAIIMAIAPYVLVRYLTKNKVAAALASLVYAYNTHFIWREQQHYTIAYAFALAPLVIWSYLKAIDSKGRFFNRYWALLIICFNISLIIEPRITFITTLVIAAHFLLSSLFNRGFIGRMGQKISAFTLSAVILTLINMYWLLPSLLSGTASSIDGLASRATIADEQYDILRALALSDHSWTGKMLTTGIPQDVLPYLWLIPITVLIILAFSKFNKEQRILIITFTSILCIGIFLTKQNSPPFENSYDLVRKIPGFFVFRTAAPFYLLTALTYSVVIGFGYSALHALRNSKSSASKAKLITALISFSVITVTFFNSLPMINGDIKGNLVHYDIHSDYTKLKMYIDKQPESFRVLWAPIKSRWGATTYIHPAVDMREIYNIDSNSPVSSVVKDMPPSVGVKDFFNNNYATYLLNSWNIKYVVLPQDDANVDWPDNYAKFSSSQEEFVELLNKQPYLKQVDIGLEDVKVYENRNYTNSLLGVNRKIYSLNDPDTLNAAVNYINLPNGYEIIDSADDKYAVKIDSIFNDTLKFKGTSQHSKLAVDRNQGSLQYTADGKSLSVDYLHKTETTVNGVSFSTDKQQNILSFSTKQHARYFLDVDSKIYSLDSNTDTPRSLETFNLSAPHKFSVLESDDSDNLLAGKGLADVWDEKIYNCGGIDDISSVSSVSLSQDATGKEIILVKSKSQAACIKLKFSVKNLKEFMLEIPYLLSPEDSSGFAFIPEADKEKAIYSPLLSLGDEKQNFTDVFNLENYSGEIGLYLYDYGSDETSQTSFYMPTVTKITELLNSSLDPSPPDYFHTPSFETGSELISSDKEYSIEGKRVNVENGSFESGSWNEQVRDCNAYNDSPIIKQEVVGNAYDGHKALRLSAKSHKACVSTSVKVPKGDFILKFRYRTSSEEAGYFYAMNSGSNRAIKGGRLSKTGNKWTEHAIPIAANDESILTIGLNVNESKDLKQYNSADFDKVEVVFSPSTKGKYLLIGDAKESDIINKDVSADIQSYKPEKIDTRLSDCNIDNISHSSRFNPQWKLSKDDMKHEKTISGMNVWLRVHDDQQEDASLNNIACSIALHYDGKKYLTMGLAVTGVSFMAFAGIYALYIIKKRVRKKK